MTKVLMSGLNPTGWKLEELAANLILDLETKNGSLAGDASPVSAEILRLNRASIESLKSVLMNQNLVLQELAKLGPDKGPGAKPRIGQGVRGPLPDGMDPRDRKLIEGLLPGQTLICVSTGRAAYLRPHLMSHIGPSVKTVVVASVDRADGALAGMRDLIVDPHFDDVAPTSLYERVHALVDKANTMREFKL